MSYQTEAEKVAELAIQGAEIKTINGVPVAILSESQEAHDFERLLPAPTRKKGRLSVQDEPSSCWSTTSIKLARLAFTPTASVPFSKPSLTTMVTVIASN